MKIENLRVIIISFCYKMFNLKKGKKAKTRKKLSPKINTSFGGFIDRTSYPRMFSYIILNLVIFAIIFYFFDLLKHSSSTEEIFFVDSIYFSVVTFATLGYGDIIPVGIGKILVIVEVLLGLFLVAVFVGKISSERQSTKLTLIYSTLHHQRILQFTNDIEKIENELKYFYNMHDNDNLLKKSKDCYDLISVIRKYLIFQALEGDIVFGNSSTLRRLYLALFPLEQFCSTITKTFGITENIIAFNKRTVLSIGEIGFQMQEFHKKEPKIVSNLNELVLERERIEKESDIIYRLYIDEVLKNRVAEVGSKYGDLLLNYRMIAAEIGMTNKLCLKCVQLKGS